MVRIHQRVHERHPELDDGDVETAWENYRFAAVRKPGEQEMRTGYDPHGRYIEMVGVFLLGGVMACLSRHDAAEQEDAEGDRGREKERLLMEFRLANGTVITDEDIERERAEYESGSWTGTLTRLRVGRPRLSDGEGNANLSFKCPKTGADLIERAAAACGMHKSEFLRSAAIEKAEKIFKSA
ncbi:hypothetical protein [Collinsella aerofaciens]|uniref:hypothetical protein n=1 Tax=Collinsella aerofaciens TaxID=74426 RepID=UPI00232C9103|nr:hypothetical protein [Collinsella aerofaciens]MDB1909270.1 hypothetical protein [Collinsella aerofaciens]MDB1911154.1 hypothetical protein [Collinsella aerofaciens]MDB1913058.1 hypothetical protein [Collinsella aerofaciens]